MMSGSGGSASKPILGEYFCDPRCSDAAGWGPDGKCAARGRVGLQEYKEYPVQTSLKPTRSQTRTKANCRIYDVDWTRPKLKTMHIG